MELQFRVGLLLPEAPERIRNNTVPGRVLGEPDAQCSRATASHAACARSGVAYLLKDAPSILQKQLSGWIQLHPARQAFEKLEADFFFQILNLARKRWLGDAQSARRAPVMLLLADRRKISQMPQFHFDTLWLLV